MIFKLITSNAKAHGNERHHRPIDVVCASVRASARQRKRENIALNAEFRLLSKPVSIESSGAHTHTLPFAPSLFAAQFMFCSYAPASLIFAG